MNEPATRRTRRRSENHAVRRSPCGAHRDECRRRLGLAAVVDQDRPLSGSDHERATAAALQHVGSGTVAETEVGEGGAAAEVEIRLDDGRQVEVERAMTELGVPGGKELPGGG
jgi:hypothetical protein